MRSIVEQRLRRVAIVGAGPSGIVTAKSLIAEACFEQIDVYEQQSSVGGTWNHSTIAPSTKIGVPQIDPNQPLEKPVWKCNVDQKVAFLTSMYGHLETNTPKPLMNFSDSPLPSTSPVFPRRHLVLKYLEKYAEDMRHLVKFHTQVEDISLEVSGSGQDVWLVRSRDLLTSSSSTIPYDAVAICSGHYTVPYIPSIPGIGEWNRTNPNIITHSRCYRDPSHFSNKKVLVVGNAASGIDIANQISNFSLNPVLNSHRSVPMFAPKSSIEGVPEIAEFLPVSSGHPRAVRFIDDRIEKEIDAALFCTGYLYSYPFLKSLPTVLVSSDGFRLQNVYQHIFYNLHPTLSFLALPMKVLPFPQAEAQAAVIARVWSGRIHLPSYSSMVAWEKARVEDKGDGKAFHQMNYPQDFIYQNKLFDWAAQTGGEVGKTAGRWDERESWLRSKLGAIKEAYAERGEEREKLTTVEELGFDFQVWLNEESGSKKE
ncbi:hypothetical protein MMC14_006738 [Varicellaria rhodocarpa]|nr:hypothetical protein [Varicellaria rhodocarpa]